MKRYLPLIVVGLLHAGCGSEPGVEDADALDIAEEPADIDAVDDQPPETVDPSPDEECTTDGDCDDEDPCTADACEAGACTHSALDADGDDFPAARVEAEDCPGDDCDDEDEDVYPGSMERTCGSDADCNGLPDEDNDGDGSDSESCGGDDCDDEDEDVHPGATEICGDGVDQDCDGSSDGLATLVSDLRITDESRGSPSRYPDLTWSGSEYGLVWDDGRTIYDEIWFVRVDDTGKIGSEILVSSDDDDHSAFPDIAWTGSEYGVAWQDQRDDLHEIYFARLAPEATVTMPETRVTFTTDSFWPSLVWTGSEYALSHAYGTYYSDYHLTRLAPSGTPIGSDVLFHDGNVLAKWTALVWTGSELGMTCSSYWGIDYIALARMTPDGVKIGDSVWISDSTSRSAYHPGLAWSGSEYMASWNYEDTSRGVTLARFAPDGTLVGSEITVSTVTPMSSPHWASIAWNGSGYGFAWTDTRDGDEEIYFAEVSPTGTILDEIRVSSSAGASSYVEMTWTGSEFGLAWVDERDGNEEIYFSRIGHCE